MNDVKAFLERPVLTLNGFQVTTGMVILALLIVMLYKKYKA